MIEQLEEITKIKISRFLLWAYIRIEYIYMVK